jgi:uncharacterized protein (DUF1501 family)
MNSNLTRRSFIRFGVDTAVSSALLASLGSFERVCAAASDTSGYKALVCIYLIGGNNGFNTFVPLTPAGYSDYTTARTNLALASGTLLPLNGTASDGYAYGMHPSCPELQTLFNSGKMAVLANVGTLVQPATPAQVQSGAVPIPPQLFSHLDQATLWQTSIANSKRTYGWAGRIADLYLSYGYNPQLPMNVNIGGGGYWQQGTTTNPYTLGIGGAPVMDDTTSGYRTGLRAQTASALLSQAASDSNLLVQQYVAVQESAASKVALVNNAYSGAGDLTTTFPSFDQDSNLGGQLHEVARLIKSRSAIGGSRQMFFVVLNGFDTHQNELSLQATLLKILSQNVNAFWNAMGEIGMQNNVTVFTASEFGRTLSSNGNGSDHAWGNHQMIVGGAVKGGLYYGTMPKLRIGGPDDVGNSGGQLVPTTSTDQYAATLAAWFGVSASDLGSLFPNLGNFAVPDLGFMG